MKPIHADKILLEMAKTFKVKNRKYSDDYLKFGKVMSALFPDGIMLKGEYNHILFNWFSWTIGKLTRFANTDLTHLDSIHDGAVYAAMIEDLIRTNKPRKRSNSKKKK